MIVSGACFEFDRSTSSANHSSFYSIHVFIVLHFFSTTIRSFAIRHTLHSPLSALCNQSSQVDILRSKRQQNIAAIPMRKQWHKISMFNFKSMMWKKSDEKMNKFEISNVMYWSSKRCLSMLKLWWNHNKRDWTTLKWIWRIPKSWPNKATIT